MGGGMQPIPLLVEYFGGEGNPVVAMEYSPATGWRNESSWRKRASESWLRKLKAQGVEWVALLGTKASGQVAVADFRVDELLASARRERRRRQPLG